MQTEDCRLGVKCRLRVECRLKTEDCRLGVKGRLSSKTIRFPTITSRVSWDLGCASCEMMAIIVMAIDVSIDLNFTSSDGLGVEHIVLR